MISYFIWCVSQLLSPTQLSDAKRYALFLTRGVIVHLYAFYSSNSIKGNNTYWYNAILCTVSYNGKIHQFTYLNCIYP